MKVNLLPVLFGRRRQFNFCERRGSYTAVWPFLRSCQLQMRIELMMWRIVFLAVISFIGFSSGHYAAKGVISGRFTKWEGLATPPGQIVEIFTAVNGAGTKPVVMIQTQEQKIYRYDPANFRWQEVGGHENYVQRQQYHCASFSPPRLPGEIIHRFADTDMCLETQNQKYYVVLADNSVWQWSHTASIMGFVIFRYLYSTIGLIVGLFLGILTLLTHWRLAKPKFESG
jgi:hypothetical protein